MRSIGSRSTTRGRSSRPRAASSLEPAFCVAAAEEGAGVCSAMPAAYCAFAVGSAEGVATTVAAAVTETYGEGVGAGEKDGCGEAPSITAGAGVAFATVCGAALGSATLPAPPPAPDETVLEGAPGAPGIAGTLYVALPNVVVNCDAAAIGRFADAGKIGDVAAHVDGRLAIGRIRDAARLAIII